MAMCVYEEAKVDCDDKGVILYPSPSAVPERRFRQVLLPASNDAEAEARPSLVKA